MLFAQEPGGVKAAGEVGDAGAAGLDLKARIGVFERTVCVTIEVQGRT